MPVGLDASACAEETTEATAPGAPEAGFVAAPARGAAIEEGANPAAPPTALETPLAVALETWRTQSGAPYAGWGLTANKSARTMTVVRPEKEVMPPFWDLLREPVEERWVEEGIVVTEIGLGEGLKKKKRRS